MAVVESLLTHLPEGYKYVALSCAGLALECFFLGLIYINMSRGKTFTKEFMESNFGGDHAKAFDGAPPRKEGYPDSGNGWYSKKLSLAQWFEFNNAQRGHLNFVEFLPAMILLTLITGFFYTKVAAWLGATLFVSRLLYIGGYVVHPRFRSAGFIPMILIVLVELGLIGYKLWKMFF